VKEARLPDTTLRTRLGATLVAIAVCSGCGSTSPAPTGPANDIEQSRIAFGSHCALDDDRE